MKMHAPFEDTTVSHTCTPHKQASEMRTTTRDKDACTFLLHRERACEQDGDEKTDYERTLAMMIRMKTR